VKLNVTALFTRRQVEAVSTALMDQAPSFISVFAERIADVSVDPVSLMHDEIAIIAKYKSK
jgi:transaldolase